MKVLLVNGSPHRKGETYNALSLVETALNEKGIGTEWFWIGNKPAAAVFKCSILDQITKNVYWRCALIL